MAGQKIELGPTGETVAENVTRIREQRALTYTEVAREMASRGRAISPLAVRRIEDGQRRVDVDDLMALSAALGVSPVTLLVPNASHGDDRIHATAISEFLRAKDLWAWLRADLPPASENENEDMLRWLSVDANLRALPEWERLEAELRLSGFVSQMRAERRAALEATEADRAKENGND